jgi:hypothetical protein
MIKKPHHAEGLVDPKVLTSLLDVVFFEKFSKFFEKKNSQNFQNFENIYYFFSKFNCNLLK